MKVSSQKVLVRVFALLFASIFIVSFTVVSVANGKCGNFDTILNTMQEQADQGVVSSQFIVGKMYLQGKCIKKDYKKAHEWLGKAAATGHIDASFYLGVLLYDESSPYKDFSRAVYWFKKVHEAGDTHATYYLGEAYLFGRGVKKNKKLAQRLLASAMRNNDPRAHYQIGYMHQKGVATGRRNYRKAFGMYTQAALLGYKDAHFKLAEFYARGLGVRRNRVKAYTWYSIAELHGHKSGSIGKDKIYRRLNSRNLAEAQGLIQRYMKSMEYSEYQ